MLDFRCNYIEFVDFFPYIDISIFSFYKKRICCLNKFKWQQIYVFSFQIHLWKKKTNLFLNATMTTKGNLRNKSVFGQCVFSIKRDSNSFQVVDVSIGIINEHFRHVPMPQGIKPATAPPKSLMPCNQKRKGVEKGVLNVEQTRFLSTASSTIFSLFSLFKLTAFDYEIVNRISSKSNQLFFLPIFTE